MCSIIGSFDKNKLIELCKLNEYRGQMSHSISYLTQEKSDTIKKELGKIDYDDINIPPDNYCIIHMQAPTGQETQIHPSTRLCFHYQDFLGLDMQILTVWKLWHNGIIKENCVNEINKKFNYDINWDTALIIEALYKNRYNILNDFDGSFSCFFEKQDVDWPYKLFRNEIAPMFIDDDFNISSTKFENSTSTKPNIVFDFNPWDKFLEEIYEFKTKNNPYYLGE
jgi:hypothetical protein